MTEQKALPAGLDQALVHLAKLIKGIKYYPPTHAKLKDIVSEAHAGFVQVLAQLPELFCEVNNDGFFFAGKRIAAKNPVLKDLAPYLHARRIRSLLFLHDIEAEELRGLGRSLILEPAETRRQGGVEQLLRKARVSSVWVNVSGLEEVVEQKKEMDRSKEHAVRAHREAEQLASKRENRQSRELEEFARVFGNLRQETSDHRIRYMVQELTPHIHLNLNDAGRDQILEALSYLATTSQNLDYAAARRKHCQQALEELADEDVLDYLVTILCDKGEEGQALRDQVLNILLCLKGKAVVWRLMDHLAEESDGQVRKVLTELMVSQGKQAIPVLVESLNDDRWFVVRNAVAILGLIGDPVVSDSLQTALEHKDARVGREAIRALTRIGGEQATGQLLRAAVGSDPDLGRQALLSLAAMKSRTAVGPLLSLLQEKRGGPKELERRKEIIKALGQIGDSNAVAVLGEIATTRGGFFSRGQQEGLRLMAIGALQNIGGQRALKFLHQVMDDKSDAVAAAAKRALRQVGKKEEGEK